MQQTSGCPSCGSPIKADQQFCGICGTKLTQCSSPSGLKCPSCGSPIIAGQQFCGTCGAKLVNSSRPASPPTPPPPLPSQTATMFRNAPVAGYDDSSSFAQSRQSEPMSTREAPKSRNRMLTFGGALFQALGWLILVIGSLVSIAYIVLGAIGGGFQMLFFSSGDIVGSTAIIIGVIGLITSLIVGFEFLVIGRLCYSLIGLKKKVNE